MKSPALTNATAKVPQLTLLFWIIKIAQNPSLDINVYIHRVQRRNHP